MTEKTNEDVAIDYLLDNLQIEYVASALAAYALNVAHGQTLAPFEIKHLIGLAKRAGCTVTPRHVEFTATRAVLAEILTERRNQVEKHGYTPEYDDANPMHAHDQVLQRAYQMPTAHARKDLVELAAIAVAEIERLDRVAAKEAASAVPPQPNN